MGYRMHILYAQVGIEMIVRIKGSCIVVWDRRGHVDIGELDDALSQVHDYDDCPRLCEVHDTGGKMRAVVVRLGQATAEQAQRIWDDARTAGKL
jgi:hypothetical protein